MGKVVFPENETMSKNNLLGVACGDVSKLATPQLVHFLKEHSIDEWTRENKLASIAHMDMSIKEFEVALSNWRNYWVNLHKKYSRIIGKNEIASLHIEASKIDRNEYVKLLQETTGKSSSKDLMLYEYLIVMKRLK